ncbi:Metallo-dependent hydrolase [Pluteus cervinus]|uniref:Metallo-dependent hydrolase n=1 Tax=Pluteus cervinus TaxID=181527 RepID=A0ACD3BAV8_9AGAR|nr:Metallo-dependent hydrolase [Pluteus cervinus]
MDHETPLIICNVRLPHLQESLASVIWRVICQNGRVLQVSTELSKETSKFGTWQEIDAKGGLLLPSLCHPHVHLDKCFILEQCGSLITGDFNEAMGLTAKTKKGFALNKDDLYARGERLVRESMGCGVTAIRAHVEVDSIVGLTCLEAGLTLKETFREQCDIQIAVFLQERLFADPNDHTPGPNLEYILQALAMDGVGAIGSAPYVEATPTQAKMNMEAIYNLAIRHGLSLDFHLDYNLDPEAEPLIHHLVTLMRLSDHSQHRPHVTVGHATRLQLFTPTEWSKLAASIRDLPLTLVGLPQSDVYMQGRVTKDTPLGAPRGTLRVPDLARDHGLQLAMGINNIENPFTPQGSVDPLSSCSFGAAIFQTATVQDLRTLITSVTLTARQALGGYLPIPSSLVPASGDPADFVILHPTHPFTSSVTLQSAALNPSSYYERTTIRAGRVVALRRAHHWVLGDNTSYALTPNVVSKGDSHQHSL